ncbi:hypothetical protein Val02_50830 [Virgisporangium aliadipatigenens]|uniref:Uncharacterized protein n=1 Tax=Virgisporangium aliadipatigenens TaxID=741659 RepID=A0A8J3YPI6_9ACTN|nr:hypothetical protein [Virgisporangium aliadipatigenens]GIJ48197.1 hypothetical protein Val02_50830 [Virgisporangium aliadipatigenens]
MAPAGSDVRPTVEHKVERDVNRTVDAHNDLQDRLREFARLRELPDDHPVVELSNVLLQYQLAEELDRNVRPAEQRQRQRLQKSPGSPAQTQQPEDAVENIVALILERLQRYLQQPSGPDQSGDRGTGQAGGQAMFGNAQQPLNVSPHQARPHSPRRPGHEERLAKDNPLLEMLNSDAWKSANEPQRRQMARQIDLNKVQSDLVAAVGAMERKHGPTVLMRPVSPPERQRENASPAQVDPSRTQIENGRSSSPQLVDPSRPERQLEAPSPRRPWQERTAQQLTDRTDLYSSSPPVERSISAPLPDRLSASSPGLERIEREHFAGRESLVSTPQRQNSPVQDLSMVPVEFRPPSSLSMTSLNMTSIRPIGSHAQNTLFAGGLSDASRRGGNTEVSFVDRTRRSAAKVAQAQQAKQAAGGK